MVPRRREDPCARGEKESDDNQVIAGGEGDLGGVAAAVGVIRDREKGSASQVRMCHAIIRSNYILPAGRV